MDQHFLDKTRVVITGNQNKTIATKLLLFVLEFVGKEIDYITSFSRRISGNDFVLFEAEDSELLDLHPNITLINPISNNQLYESYLKTITAGGIVIYDETDLNLANLVEASENYFRKIAYQMPPFENTANTIILQTDLGDIPIKISENQLNFIEGVKQLSQQLGVMEEEFYEALMLFEI